MERSPSWEAKRFSASQEIPRIVWNPNVYYHVYKWSAGHLSLSWARPIQSMPPSHFLKIHLNIILPFTPGSSKWSLSLTTVANYRTKLPAVVWEIFEDFRGISKFVCIYSTISQGTFKCVPRILTVPRMSSCKNLKIRMSFCIPKYRQDDEDF